MKNVFTPQVSVWQIPTGEWIVGTENTLPQGLILGKFKTREGAEKMAEQPGVLRFAFAKVRRDLRKVGFQVFEN